jgi:hypothetical protein
MFTRDLCAACTGFASASSLLAIVRYLSEPTAAFAVLLVACAVTFVISLAFYAGVVSTRNAPQRSKRTATRPTRAQRSSVVSNVRPTRQVGTARQQPVTA